MASWTEDLITCNYSPANRQPGDVDTVILHTLQGSYSGAISWFHNCAASVSAHYVVSQGGAVTQFVAEGDLAWHASCANSSSIGVQMEGYVSAAYPDALYMATAEVVAGILCRWSLPADRDHVIGHSEVPSTCNANGYTDPGPGWDWDYFMTLLAVAECGQ